MDWVKKRDVDFAAQMVLLVGEVSANDVAYGLASDGFAGAEVQLSAFNTALANADAKKAEYELAVAAKDAARETLEATVRPVVQQIQLRPSVTDAMRLAAGIPVRDTTRTVNSPVAPSSLVASIVSPTSAQLKWSGAGNTSGVQYVIEKRVANAGDWLRVDVVMAQKFLVQGLVAGQRVDFRVLARRGTQYSDPSNTAAVYAD